MSAPNSPITMTITITASDTATTVSVDAESAHNDDSAETRDCLAALRPIVVAYATEAARAVAKEITGREVTTAFQVGAAPNHRRAGRA